MLKHITVLFCFLFIAQMTLANQVDDLKTNVDVEKFITSLDKVFQKKHSPEFLVNSIDVIKKHLDCIGDTEIPEIKNWEKADFNNDGNTDLLVLGYWVAMPRILQWTTEIIHSS